jgi:hypothetical protein
MHRRRWPHGLMLIALCWLMSACGQKGPPLAPLHLVPAGVSEPAVRRIGDQVRLRFVLPNRNENGPGALELDRVEIYAMTVSPGGEPSAREVMSKEHLIGQIAVRPVLEEGEQPAPDEKRPEPGTAVSFDEELTAAKLKPEPVKDPVKPPVPRATVPGADAKPGAAAAPAATPPGAAAPATAAPAAAAPATTPPAATAPATAPPATPPAAAAAPVPKHVRRLYIARGVTKGGRPGTASAPLAIPLVDLPTPPQDANARVTERAVVLEWTAADTPTSYNVYRGDDLMQPLNAAPLTAPGFEDANAALGQEQCYRVRAIALVDGVSLEGEPSAPRCITPRDEFPPAAPAGLAAVPTPGQISLIWDANPEKDLAGYLILRGDAPDGPLKAITAAPIRETSYRDATVKPGMRYVYAIVAVDSATPPNMSAQSARVEETAR